MSERGQGNHHRQETTPGFRRGQRDRSPDIRLAQNLVRGDDQFASGQIMPDRRRHRDELDGDPYRQGRQQDERRPNSQPVRALHAHHSPATEQNSAGTKEGQRRHIAPRRSAGQKYEGKEKQRHPALQLCRAMPLRTRRPFCSVVHYIAILALLWRNVQQQRPFRRQLKGDTPDGKLARTASASARTVRPRRRAPLPRGRRETSAGGPQGRSQPVRRCEKRRYRRRSGWPAHRVRW